MAVRYVGSHPRRFRARGKGGSREAAAHQVFNLQLPLSSTEPVPYCLAYNRAGETMQLAITPELAALFAGRLKIFVLAALSKAGVFDIRKEASWQTW